MSSENASDSLKDGKRILLLTKDGSNTLLIEGSEATYHSRYGAIQESNHIYIGKGLYEALEIFGKESTLNILEVGFGTGLNALLTYRAAKLTSTPIFYHALEPYPLSEELILLMNYEFPEIREEVFKTFHHTKWNAPSVIANDFILFKDFSFVEKCVLNNNFHLIYFDAFSPTLQPHLWTKEIFSKLYEHTLPNGILVTFSSKGDVRRAMTAAGWKVEKLEGPPGKIEIVRARK